MRKLWIVMVAVLCAGTAGMVWAAEVDYFDKAAGSGSVTGTNNPALNPQPLPPGFKSQGDGGTQVRKAGGTQMTTDDKAQITGNLTSGTGAGAGKVSKAASLHKNTNKAYFLKFNSKTNSYDKWSKVNGKTVPYTGGAGSGKASLNNSTFIGPGTKTNGNGGKGLEKPAAVDTFHKPAILQKDQNNLSKGELLPAVKN
jgi:hypothetical protein